jgi:hypothetical protein
MTRALICTGVLGGGTAIVFALALAASILFPQGSLVPVSWNGGWGRPMIVNDLRINDVGADGWVEQVAPPPIMVDPAIPVPAPVEAES